MIKIWGDVFGDSQEVSSRLLDDFAGPDNIYVAEKNGEVISQLMAVPCEAAGRKGTYLYALATVPEQRSHGVMAKLMDHTEEQVRAVGGSFFILIPASASLFDYYKANGFDNVYLLNMDLNIDCSVNDDFEHMDFSTGEIPTDLFLDLRRRYGSREAVSFSRDRIDFEMEEQWYYKCSSVFCEDGYAIYQKVDDILFITEVAAATENLALNLISHAKMISGCKNVKVTLPTDSKLFIGKGYNVIQTAQAQYKWWGEGEAPKFYLRFALDDLPARIEANKEDMIL